MKSTSSKLKPQSIERPATMVSNLFWKTREHPSVPMIDAKEARSLVSGCSNFILLFVAA